MTTMFPTCKTILLHEGPGILRITLNRPDARNAMTLAMIQELMNTFETIAGNTRIRVVVLRGSDGNFCAGGDIKDLSRARAVVSNPDMDPIFTLNRAFGRLLTQINDAPQVVITLLEGAVLGGGIGLACVSDIAIADGDSKFGIPETSLGLPPAQIVPFVVARVGLTKARRMILTGAHFDGHDARALGVVHFTTNSNEEMEDLQQQQLEQIMRCAPLANRVTKKLIHHVGVIEHEVLLDNAAREFSAAVRGEEGIEGMLAFIEKRHADWAK